MTKLARKISDGLYGRLEFDFACERGHGFSEMYVHGVVLEIIASHLDPAQKSVLPAHAIPELQSDPPAPGRKREVDFGILDRNTDQIDVCIEAKWAKSSHASPQGILADACRLAVVARARPNTICLFVLAGPKRDVARLATKELFTDHGPGKKKQRLFRFDNIQNSYFINSTAHTAAALPNAMRAKLREKLPVLPDHIRSHLYKPSHLDTPNWSVYVWRIFP